MIGARGLGGDFFTPEFTEKQLDSLIGFQGKTFHTLHK